MKVKNEVAATLASRADDYDKLSVYFADLGEYGVSDRADKIRDGILKARELYLNSFKKHPLDVLDEELNKLFTPDNRTPFRRFLEDAPVGSRLIGKQFGYTSYTKVIGGWRGDDRNTTWQTANFDDNEADYFKLVTA